MTKLGSSFFVLGVVMSKQEGPMQEATVGKLRLNTKYRFRVRAVLVNAGTGVVVERGDWSKNSDLIKTSCIPPDPPKIVRIDAGTDLFANRATLTVHWEVRTYNYIPCYYREYCRRSC